MSVRSAQSVTTEFTTNDSTGALVDADSLPTGTLYVNGTANGAAVTVTNNATGQYKAAVTMPTLAVGDVVSIIILATVDAIAGGGKVWEDSKDFFAGSIPDVVAGGTNGLFIAGTNAATTVASFTCSGTFLVNAFTCTVNFLVSGNYTVTGTTTHTGAVSFGSTFGVTGTVTFNAFTCTNNFTVSGNWLTTGTTTWTGAATISNASNNIFANVKKVNSVTVNGTGTALDPWGP